MQLVAGQRKSLQVGDVPFLIAQRLNCHPAIVYLGHKEVLKIVGKHGEGIRVEQLQTIWLAIRDGEYRSDPNRTNKAISVYYREPVSSELYVVGLKRVSGCELWVSTFYRSGDKKQANQRSRGELLRGQVSKS